MMNNSRETLETINSENYWNKRFETDWDLYSGSEQTRFFGELSSALMPEWLVRKIRFNQYSVCDMGCALGEATDFLSKFLNVPVDGMDFSSEAIRKAKISFPYLRFYQHDFMTDKLENPYNVVYCSNVLEHFSAPWSVFKKLAEISSDYILIQIPFRETLEIKEHFYTFDVNNIPVYLEKFYLVYTNVIDGRKITDSLYPDNQILLIYSKHEEDLQVTYMSDTASNLLELDNEVIRELKLDLKEFKERNIQFENTIHELQEKNNSLESNAKILLEERDSLDRKLQLQSEQYEKDYQHLRNEITSLADKTNTLLTEIDTITLNAQAQASRYENTIKDLQERNDALEKVTKVLAEERDKLERKVQFQSEQYEKDYQHLQDEVVSLVDKKNVLLTELNAATHNTQEQSIQFEKRFTELEQQNRTLIQERDAAKSKATELKNNILCAQNEVIRLSEAKTYKLAHLLYRLKYQAFSKSKEERAQFRRWITSKIKTNIGERDHRYNPLFRIMECFTTESLETITSGIAVTSTNTNEEEDIKRLIPQTLSEELNQEYTKFDVIVFSVIDYDFRYQRPQQIADHFAQKGHRVFYIDADFISGNGPTIKKHKENLYIVKLPNNIHPSVYSTDFTDSGVNINQILDELLYQYCIRDALIIADYPTWINGMEYLKNTYGFPIITDYMDDFTGFDNAQDAFIEEACKRLLTVSDYVVASSQYLMEIAKQYNSNVEPIRNGTEFAHFHAAYLKTPSVKKRPVIGYYGAIAHWFAFEKVEYLAQNLPEVDIILIGSVTETNHNLNKYSNVKFLGEKPYKELPEYLKDFDVCLIPFDTSTNLIKATNPVKFYEYLSAGKKIVASEIPELMPFKDQYVYLTNDNEMFLKQVKLCLDGRDTLANPEQCFEFAKQNDWSNRVAKFAETANRIFPKVSIVVLCYNQLDYTKECVESILKNTAYPNYELILVDNNSTDDTANYLQYLDIKEPKIKIVLNKTNRGFAGGNNDGISIAEGDYLVLLNNDTVVTRGWLTNMVKRFSVDAKVGIVGPVTNSIGNEAKIDVLYNDIADMPAFAYWYTYNHMNQHYPNIGVLAMFCVMIRKTMMDEIGLLDEAYGVGMFEDDDYSMAAKKAGYSICLSEDVFIHHYGSVSFKKLEDEKYRKLFENNKKYYEDKWNTTWVMHHYRK